VFAALGYSDSVACTIDALLQALAGLTKYRFQVIVVTVRDEGRFKSLYEDKVDVYSDPGGIAAAWNIGLIKSYGEYVNFIGDGDYPSKHALNSICASIAGSDRRPIYNCKGVFVDRGNVVRYLRPTRLVVANYFGVNVHTPCLYIPRSELKDFVFPEKYKYAMDVVMVKHLVGRVVPVRPIDYPVVIEDNGISVKFRWLAIGEYLDVVSDRVVVLRALHALVMLLYRPYRMLKMLAGTCVRDWLRSIKHLLVFLLNVCVNILPGGFFRNRLLGAISIHLGTGSSIRSIVRLYGVGNVVIGENSVVNRGCILDNRGKISIGSNVSISHEVKIYTAGHNLKSPYFEQVVRNVVIEDYVAIFPGSIINPGAHLKYGCVILGGSVVYGEFPENSIIAGNPAIKVGERNGVYKYSCKYDVRFAQ